MSERPRLLLVDDEERILRSLALLFRSHYDLRMTTDPAQALQIAANEPVDVVISDQRMPQMRGADLLQRIRACNPRAMRILLTGYSEMEAIVASVNEGEIFRYVAKPWNAVELRATVVEAVAASRAEAPQAVVQEAQTAGILVIDDDEATFTAVQAGTAQPVFWARSLAAVLSRLERGDIGVIVSELSVAGEPLAPALKLLKSRHPELVTIVITQFRNTETLVRLINEAQVFRMLPKPARSGPLGISVGAAIRQHEALCANPALQLRHRVEAIRAPEEQQLAARFTGWLARLRGRAAAPE